MNYFFELVIAIAIVLIGFFVGIDAIMLMLSALWDTVKADFTRAIAVIALVATAMQAMYSREHNKLSVRPLLKFDEDTIIKNNIIYDKFLLINAGIGPAIIKKVELFFDGKVVSCNDYKTYYIFLRKKLKRFIHGDIGYFPCGDVVSVGQTELMWTLKYRNTKKDIETVNKLHLRIEYQSIYQGKVFIFDTKDFQDSHKKELT